MIALDRQCVRAQIRHSLHHYWLLEGVLSGFNLGGERVIKGDGLGVWAWCLGWCFKKKGVGLFVADEVVYKELGDSLVRAGTTASSLEVEPDNGETIAQTRFENVSKHSNDSLLARGNTLQSNEDSLKLTKLMEICTNLQQRVLNLEKTKTTQQNEIASLKKRVKKLEQKKRLRTHGMKRLHKVGMSRRVVSSGDEEDLGEDASKQGRRINVIDVDEDITLVSVQDDAGAELFDVGTLIGAEVFVEQEVAAKGMNLTVDEVTLAQALEALKSVKPKLKGDVIKEPNVPVNVASASTKISAAKTTTATIPTPRKGIVITELGTPTITRSLQQPSQAKVQDKGKGKMIALKLQAEIDEEERIARAEEEKIDEANIAWDDIQAKVDADYQLAERLQAEEQEQFTIEEKATLFKELLEQRRKHFAAKRAEEKRNKPPTKTQQKKTMITYLKNMEGWKHKDLKSKDFDSIKELFDKAFKRVNMFVDFRTDLVEGSSKRAGEELEQESTKKQKVDDDKETAELKQCLEIIPDEEEVTIDAIPLAVKSPRIVDWKIHKEGKKSYYQIVRADGKSQMYMIFSHMLKSFDREDLEDLYKLVKARYGSTRPVEDLDLVLWNDLKNMFEPHVEDTVWRNQQSYKVLEWKLYDSYGITAALIDVNAAQSKLVLLENFNENYSKCLRLLVKLQLPVHRVNAASEEVSTAELIESHKSSTELPIVNDSVIINIPEEDVEPKQIILDPDDQPMWERNKFDGYLQADLHDHIREFLAIYNVFRYGETQSEVVKLLIFPFSLCDKTWFNKLNEESITSWEQMRKSFISRFFPPLLFNRLLLEIRSFSQFVCESLTEAWLLRKCHGHGLTKGAIIQIFYHGLDEPTQGILDITAGGIFLYKSPNQAFQFLDDKVLFKLDWSTKSQNEHHRKSVSFADRSNSNDDNFRLIESLEALTIKKDSQIISLNKELQDIRNKYNELRNGNASKNNMNDDTPMCERHEANYIQSEGYQNRNSPDSHSNQSHHDRNDSEKSLTELNNDVRNDLEDFKRCIHSMRTVHWKLFARDDGKTTDVLPKKKSKPINQEPQSKTDLEESIIKFLDGQRVTNIKIGEWEKSQNVSSKQTDMTNPPLLQAQTEQVNVVFTGSRKSDDSLKIQKGPPPPIIVNNKIRKDKPIKTSKGNYHMIKTKEYPFQSRKSPTKSLFDVGSRRISIVIVNTKEYHSDVLYLCPSEIFDVSRWL
ncbi:putative ribonuclease H-like domain-containing protein [Tanacetum coccineum]